MCIKIFGYAYVCVCMFLDLLLLEAVGYID